MDPDEDRLLLERTASGDARAFEAFVRRWEGPLYRFLRRVTGSDALAEDARQVTLLRAYHHAPRFRGGSVAVWLFRTAFRSARNLARGAERGRAVGLDAAAHVRDAGPSPAACAVAAEQGDALARSLARLEPDDRALLWLRVAEGLSLDESARVLRAPASTLRYRFERALARLRREIAEPARHASAAPLLGARLPDDPLPEGVSDGVH